VSTKNIEIRLKGENYDCFIQDGNIVSIYKNIPFQASVALGVDRVADLYAVRKLSGLWLKIAAILAERGEL